MRKGAQNSVENTRKLLLSLPKNDMKMIEDLVGIGRFSTKSEAVRFAVKKVLYDEERMRRFDEASKVVRQRVEELGLTRKDINKMIEEVKDETRKKVDKMLREMDKRKTASRRRR